MPRVAVYSPHLGDSPTTLTVEGEEAHHALRVRRLGEGDLIDVHDGCGHIAHCRIVSTEKSRAGEWRLSAAVLEMRTPARPCPTLHVLTSSPKGDHLTEMVGGLSQAGAASWRALRTTRTVVEPGAHKHERLHRIAIESMKQCGRAWRLDILPMLDFHNALRPEPGHRLIIADASGAPYSPEDTCRSPVSLLIGPEGGFTGEELDQAHAAGATIARFGPHTMRIETAAIAATAIIMHGCSRG